jgi:mRNA-degrading endonuclease toxin of MazEF toxin-antitoxin module
MPYSQGQIVEVDFRLPPDGEYKNHPVVVLSNSDINAYEQGFVAAMMTTTNPDDEYSFEIKDSMLTRPYNDRRHREIRMNLIGYFLDGDVIPSTHPRAILKTEHLKRLITQINTSTFGFDVEVKV